MMVVERDGRLFLQFWDPDFAVMQEGYFTAKRMTKEIDITTHIEKAVENVLNRREGKTDA